jgi:hypothetical protein
MPTKEELREHLRNNLDATIARLNSALRAKNLKPLKPVLSRIGRGQQLPHWYEQLSKKATLPNLDGKTVGSVVEMLLVAVLETETFHGLGAPPLRINPARGVDLPDLDLGIKSPSENFCTSEPFFSAYERILGTDHDALVLLTDYQTAKRTTPLRLQIIRWRYLTKTQIADENLCILARRHRAWLFDKNESWLKKLVRFLAFVNQSDWRAKQLLRFIAALHTQASIPDLIAQARGDFEKQNRARLKKDRPPIPDTDIEAICNIEKVTPVELGVIDAADNWVVEIQGELARVPNENEWNRFLAGPLDGKIGMSYALQWRYNFGRLFGEADAGTCPDIAVDE